MQKITYENLLGEIIEFGAGGPYLLANATGIGATDAEIITARGVYQSGVTTRRTARLKRNVKASITIYGARTRAEMYDLRREMARKLSLERCFEESSGRMGRLTYENDAGRYWAYAIPETPPADGERKGNALGNMTVTFQCDSPYWNEQGEQVRVLRMGGDGLKLPFMLPMRLGTAAFEGICENEGAISAPVRIRVDGTGETPEIVNQTTGASIRIERQIASGEALVIDTEAESVSVQIEHADGTREDAFGYLNAQSALTAFLLRPGRNVVRYVPSRASSASRVTIRWRTRHEGV